MSRRQKRVDTLKVLTLGASSRIGAGALQNVLNELEEISSTGRITPIKRRHLQQVFHSLRALESALKQIIASHGHAPQESFGKLFYQMKDLPFNHPCHLDARSFGRFHKYLRDERNKYMHTADSFPRTERETNRLLGEIDSCFSQFVK